jgi:hypothetical protein
MQKCCDGDNFYRFDSMKAQEIIITADEPAYAGGDGTGNELGVIGIAQLGDGGRSDGGFRTRASSISIFATVPCITGNFR